MEEENEISLTYEKELTGEEKELLSKQNSRLVTPFLSSKLEKDAKKHWDLFYKRNENRFFKDRHWISREFGEILNKKGILLEVGCGAGNLIFPFVGENPGWIVYACDFSERACNLVKLNPSFDPTTMTVFQTDLTVSDCFFNANFQLPLVDVVTLVFVLSSVHPDKFATVVLNLFSALKCGGAIFFRDYGLHDMAQLRFKPGHKISDNFYMRQDGTRSYFFSVKKVNEIFSSAGFEIIFNSYVERRTVNKKEDIDVPRVFIQGKFIKPG